MSADDFRRMLNRRRETGEQSTNVAPVPGMDNTMRLLCLLCLRDPLTRAWVLERDWRKVLADRAGSDLLAKVLEADIRPDDPKSVSAFMARLDAEEESVVASLIGDKVPERTEMVAHDCWNDLERRELKRCQEVLSSRLRLPNLSFDEVAAVQKEILDLQHRLIDIARPFPSAPP